MRQVELTADPVALYRAAKKDPARKRRFAKAEAELRAIIHRVGQQVDANTGSAMRPFVATKKTPKRLPPQAPKERQCPRGVCQNRFMAGPHTPPNALCPTCREECRKIAKKRSRSEASRKRKNDQLRQKRAAFREAA